MLRDMLATVQDRSILAVDAAADWPAEDLDDLLALIGEVDDARRTLGFMFDHLAARADFLGVGYQAPVPGGGIFKWSGGSDKVRWDATKLIGDMARRMQSVWKLEAVVTQDGERGDPEPLIREAIQQTAAAAGATAPSHGWRTTPLKALGLNPDDYRRTEPGQKTYRLEGRDRR